MSLSKAVEAYVHGRVERALQTGILNEFTWIDFKREWDDLRDDTHRSDFLKKVCAFANAGVESILVYGVGRDAPKTMPRTFQAPISSARMGDGANIVQLVRMEIHPRVTVEHGEIDHGADRLSFVVIPVTHDRPHVVRRFRGKDGRVFESAMFFRSGDTVLGPDGSPPWLPPRGLLDEMYLDRPGHAARIVVREWNGERAIARPEPRDTIHFDTPIQFFNIGTCATSVVSMRLSGQLIRTFEDSSSQTVELPPADVTQFFYKGSTQALDRLPLHVPPGQSQAIHARYGVALSVLSALRGDGPMHLAMRVDVQDIFEMESNGTISAPVHGLQGYRGR